MKTTLKHWYLNSGGFTPADIPSAYAWWDGQDLATITKDGGDAVSSFVDKINSIDCIQGTGINQPIWTDSSLNGKATIWFDGVNDRLYSVRITDLEGISKMTLFIVGYLRSSTGANLAGYGADSGHRFFQSQGIGNSNSLLINVAASYGVYTSDLENDQIISAMVFDGTQSTNETKLKKYRNGVQKTLTFTGTIPTTTATSATAIFEMGAQMRGAAFSKSSIAEVIVFTDALSDVDRGLVEAYLSSKYSI